MLKLISKVKVARHFARDESGATAIEYGLIAGLIAVLIIGGLTIMGPALQDMFTDIGNILAGVDRPE